MKTLAAATIFVGSLAFPAFAQMADDMSCADFMAMDASAQMAAMETMGGMMMEGDDAMKSDDMAKGEMAEGEMEVTAETVAEGCADHGDMMVSDIVEQAKMAK